MLVRVRRRPSYFSVAAVTSALRDSNDTLSSEHTHTHTPTARSEAHAHSWNVSAEELEEFHIWFPAARSFMEVVIKERSFPELQEDSVYHLTPDTHMKVLHRAISTKPNLSQASKPSDVTH